MLFEGKESTSSVNIKEFSPEGGKIDVHLAGEVNGKVKGFILTTHNALMRPDGKAEIDLRSIIFSNGEPIFVWGKATSEVVDPTPIRKIEEDLTFQTPSQRLSYLNTTKGRSEGFYNLRKGEYIFKVYAVK